MCIYISLECKTLGLGSGGGGVPEEQDTGKVPGSPWLAVCDNAKQLSPVRSIDRVSCTFKFRIVCKNFMNGYF